MYILVSLLLHAALFIPLYLNGGNGGGGGPAEVTGKGAQAEKIEIVVKKEEKPVVEAPPTVKEEQGPKRPEPVEATCPKFFGGVGMQFNNFNMLGQIIKVFPGYPASEVGLQVDDIFDIPEEGIRGEIGTEITLRVTRGHEVFLVRMVRAKICYQEDKHAPN